MSQVSTSVKELANRKTAVSVILFILIAVGGLLYVKWLPYYDKAFIAAAKHSIGSSIVSGTQASAPAPSWSAAWSYTVSYYNSVWKAVILGIVLGSLVQILIPQNWLVRALGKASFGSTALGGVASLPGMMCTCCAAPLAVGLRKQKVSVGAAMAFWLGNPTLNLATLIFMTFVLSWKFTLLRIVMGLILVFGVSYVANRFANQTHVPDEVYEKLDERPEQGSFFVRWLKSMGKMIVNVIPAYVVAVMALGAIRAWLFPSVGDFAADGLLLIIFFSIVGMLFVIPTAAEIPIIQSMMSFGLGAGAASALSLTLPALSIPSLLMVRKAFPGRVLAFVTVSVVVLGIVSGIIGMLFM